MTKISARRLCNVYGDFGTGYAGNVWDADYLCPTIDTAQGGGRQPMIAEQTSRIRKLTPRECWKLMGFSDSDFSKAEKVNSNAQLYKEAGNSIVVPVLEAIFRQMLGDSE